MAATFRVSIDESGDEGFRFARGTPEWLVVAAAIVRIADESHIGQTYDLVRKRYGVQPRKPIHFRDLSHQRKLDYCARLAALRVRSVAVLVHKPSLEQRDTFKISGVLYSYAVRYLLERVSYCCRAARSVCTEGDGSAELVFSKRATFPYDNFQDYLARLEASEQGKTINWSVIRPQQLTAQTAGKWIGLQMVDAIAASFGKGVNAGPQGTCLSCYAEALKPIMYRGISGRYIGNGVKVFPLTGSGPVHTDSRLAWIGRTYGPLK